MNSRIELVSADSVSIRHHSKDAGVTTLRVNAGRDSINRNSAGTDYWDAEGRAALRDCLNCFDQTGSFAALADTSDVPYSGKRVRLKDHNGEVLGFIIRQRDDRKGFYYFRDDHKDMFVYSTTDGITILPLTPAPPKRVIRAYTPVEAAAHLGRSMKASPHPSFTVRYVSINGFHAAGGAVYPFASAAKECSWADDNSPCGIEEAT